jgi:DNA-binding MarR family transcriptional regulator
VLRKNDNNNRRITKIFITETGRKLVEQVQPHIKELHGKLINGLNTSEINVLRTALLKICDNLEENFSLQI